MVFSFSMKYSVIGFPFIKDPVYPKFKEVTLCSNRMILALNVAATQVLPDHFTQLGTFLTKTDYLTATLHFYQADKSNLPFFNKLLK